MSLADDVIQANEDEAISNIGPGVDDIGFPLPKPQTEKAWCEYLTARLLYLNPRIYFHNDRLWIDNYIVREDKNSYYRLARYPKKIADHENEYVWTRLRDIVPRLDTDKVAVLPDVTFNMKTGEFKHEEVFTTTPWEEEDVYN
jgi:hypothetical protein